MGLKSKATKVLRSLTPKPGDRDTVEFFGKTLYKTGVPEGQRKSGAGLHSIPENKIILQRAKELQIKKPGKRFSEKLHEKEFNEGIKKHWGGDREKFFREVESEDDAARIGTSEEALNRTLDQMGLHTDAQIDHLQKNLRKQSKRKHLKVITPKKKN